MLKLSIPIVVINTGNAEEEALQRTLRSGHLGQGPEVAALEQYLSGQMGGAANGAGCVAMHSCTAALHLALLSLGVGPGDSVAVPGFSFVASANAVEYCGATPVLVDVDPRTYNMNPQQLNQVLKKAAKPLKVVMIVHEFGLCAAMDAIQPIIPRGTFLLEDAACAYGSKFQGKPAGSFGDIACFSLHPRKVVTCGEGGWLLSKHQEWVERARLLRSHGLTTDYEMLELGYNYRMTDLQAAVALSQIKRAPEFIEGRSRVAKLYDQKLANLAELQLPFRHPDYTENYQAYVMALRPKWFAPGELASYQRLRGYRDQVIRELEAQGISARISAYALHDVVYYRKKYGYQPLDFPGSLLAAASSMALPIFPDLSEAQVDRVVDGIKKALKKVSV